MKTIPFSELLKHFAPYLDEKDLIEMRLEGELMDKKKEELEAEEYIEWLKEQGI